MADESWSVLATLTASDQISPVLEQLRANIAQTQAGLDKLGGAKVGQSAAAITRTTTALQAQIDALTGVSTATKDAAASGSVFERALGVQAQRVNQLQTAMGLVAPATSGAATEMRNATKEAEGLKLSVPAATREFRALFDELSSGRTRQTPGTLAIIANRVFGLQGAGLAAALGVGAMAVALAEVLVKGEEATRAVNEMEAAMAANGRGADADAAALRALIDQARQLPTVTNASATEMTTQLARAGEVSRDQYASMIKAAAGFASITGEEQPKAMARLLAALKDGAEGIRKLELEHHFLSVAQLETINGAERNHDEITVLNTAVDAMTTGFGNATAKQTETQKVMHELGNEVTSVTEAINGAINATIGLAREFPGLTSAIASVLPGIREINAALQGLHAASSLVSLSGPANQIEALQGRVDALKARIAAAPTGLPLETEGARRELKTLEDQLTDLKAKAKQPTAALPAGPVDPDARATKAMIDAGQQDEATLARRKQLQVDIEALQSSTAGDAAEKARALATLQRELAATHLTDEKLDHDRRMADFDIQLAKAKDNAEARIAIEKQIQAEKIRYAGADSPEAIQSGVAVAQAQAAAARQGGQELVAATREAASEIASNQTLSHAEQLAGEKQLWANLLAGTQLNIRQRIQAQREYDNLAVQEARAATAQKNAVAQADDSANLQILRLGLEQKKTIAEEDFQAHKITADQKLAVDKDAATRAEAAEEDSVRRQMAVIEADGGKYTGEWEKLFDEIAVLRAKLNVDLAAYDRAYLADSQKTLKQDQEQWKSAIGEITSAEGKLVSDIFQKRQSLGKDLAQVGLQMVQNEIANDVKALTAHELYNALGLANDQQTEKGGILFHLLGEQTKVAATAAGAQAQIAAKAGAQAEGEAIDATAGSASVMGDAYKAAAGAYAALAGIPIIGPIIAPIAAGTAFAAVAAFDVFSAAGGFDDVPYDGALIMGHQHEMMLPASIAGPLRQMVAGGADAGRSYGIPANDPGFAQEAASTGTFGDVHLHMPSTIHHSGSDMDFNRALMDNAHHVRKMMRDEIRHGRVSVRR